MRFRFALGYFVGVHTARAPSADAWTAHCADIERRRNETRGALVYTLGGGPDSKQREQLRSALHGLEAPPTAIMTASPLVRGIVTGLNWFFRDPGIAAFSHDDFNGALKYLSKNGAVPTDQLLEVLVQLANEMGVSLAFMARGAVKFR